jgi:hypothetical protein
VIDRLAGSIRIFMQVVLPNIRDEVHREDLKAGEYQNMFQINQSRC